MAVITISRQYGSGGNHIAGLVRERLGYRFFDKHLMAQLGLETGLISRKVIDAPEEEVHVVGLLERFFSTSWAPGTDAAAATFGANAETFRQLSPELTQKLILAAYQHDNVIIVGRGGQIVLRGKPDVLSIRTIAPLETRITRVAQWEGLPLDAAGKVIRDRERTAAEYVKQTYSADINDATLYDLMINTGTLTSEAAADLIIAALAILPERARA